MKHFEKQASFWLARLTILGVFLGAIGVGPGARTTNAAGSLKSQHARVRLVAETTAVQPGDTVELGVSFALDPEWHIYWKNPGDSGQVPKMVWMLPAGFEVGEVVWPAPHRIASGPLMNYGYENQAFLRTTLKVPNPLPAELVAAKQVEIAAHVRFLICREDCLPAEAEVSLPLGLGGAAGELPAETVALFTQARDQDPRPLATVRVADEGTHVAVELPRPEGLPLGTKLALIPETPLLIANAVPQVLEEDEGRVRILAEKADPEAAVDGLAGLVVTEGAPWRAWSFAERAEPKAGAAMQPPEAAPAVPSGPPVTLWWALGLAFLGGMLLNLMPCVFPVLSLKVLGFVSHAHDAPKARRHGWAYAAGVLASFWALALVLVIVRAGSQRLGWGFQLQSPVFVALLCGLMVLVGLNLLGVFEVGLSFTRLGGVGGGGTWGSFNTGVLATVVATPCTAPFMGTALGFALTRPALESFAVFTALAAGMAFPYVWLSHAPAVLKRLPRPGRWMEVLRQFLAFPILATVIWLLAVFSQLTGALAVFELLGALLVVALAAWIYGSFQRSSGRPALALLLAGLSLVAGGWLGVRAAETAPEAVASARGTQGEDFWQPWSPARVAELRAQGRPVFVNFTAAWCISCKTNEILVFSTPEVRQAFAAHDVVPLKADWTHRDEVIAEELEAHGRAGVPLYLYYPQGGKAAPETLPSVLTKGLVLDVLAAATR